MATLHNFVQQSPEWFTARAGRATASRIADIVAKTKSGTSASRANYAAQLVAERLTGTVEPMFTSAAMAWGAEKEAEARAAYAFLHNADVAEVGFVDHPQIGMAGASPDGMVAHDGLVEIKCPNTATHIETLLGGNVPGKYVIQMQWQMACTGRAWCDFVSFDPRLPEFMRLFVKRVPRCDVTIADLETEVAAFLQDVTETVEQLRAKYETGAPLSILHAG